MDAGLAETLEVKSIGIMTDWALQVTSQLCSDGNCDGSRNCSCQRSVIGQNGVPFTSRALRCISLFLCVVKLAANSRA